MNFLWIGIPKSKISDRVFGNQFAISHTFEVFKYNASASTCTLIDIPVNVECTNCISGQDLLAKLPYLIDIWSRWDIRSELSWGQLSQISIRKVSDIIHILLYLRIDQVVAGYATPHHFWNNLVELACELLQIPVFHIYPFLELDISIPIFSNNHNLVSSPQAEPNQEWTRYTSSKISSYVERVKKIAFSSESKKCFNQLYSDHFSVKYYRYCRIFKSSLASFLKGSNSYNPLSFAGLATNHFSTLTALHHIQDNQNRAISFYLRNVSSCLNLYETTESTTFLLIGHVQPEASSAPMGGKYYCQIKVARYLRSMCSTCRILYREHPGSFYAILPGGFESYVGISRNVSYYKELLALGVEFISATGNVISLLKEYPHLIPVTITGSVAVEAPISIASPCIYFGEPYWYGYPGAIFYKDIDWSNINEQLTSIRSNPNLLTQRSIQWITDRASLCCLPNILGYGISSKEIPFSDSLEDLFYSRLNYFLAK